MTTSDDRPLDPASVASATFATSRRGFDPNEVRAYLQGLSAQMQVVTEREATVRRELEELQASPARSGELDDATVAAWLGEEAARVLTTAREAATQLRAKAQDQSDQLLMEAQVEADRVRNEANEEAARLRADVAAEVSRYQQEALAEAGAEIEGARQEGRSMVSEARAVRERMLADLSRRRDGARTQLAALRGERDRIVNAIEATREHLDRLMDDLRAASPDDDRDLPPMPYEQDLRGIATEPRLTLVRSLHPVHQDRERSATDDAGALLGELSPDLIGDPTVEAPGPDVIVEVGPDAGVGTEPEIVLEPVWATDEDAPAQLVDDPVVERDDPVDVVIVDGAYDDPAKPSVDDLFARIRAARSDVVVTGGVLSSQEGGGLADEVIGDGHDEEAEPLDHDAVLVLARDDAVAPYQTALARQLKRALADEQNEVFDRLRRVAHISGAQEVLGQDTDHAERYRAAGEDAVWSAALAGARSVALAGDEVDGGLEAALERHSVLDEVLDEVSLEVSMPLRERLEASIDASGGDPEEATSLLRNTYREWKSQRIDELAAELVLGAYGRGAFAAAAPGTLIRWVIDAASPSCDDAVANASAGYLPCGESFPTGHRHPPAHAGCRCLIAVTHG